MTPRAVANQAVDKQIAKHYEELQQHGAAEPRLAPAWPEPAVAPPEPAANDQPGRSPIPSEGGEGLPSSAPDDGGWGELGRAADEGARADALMRRRKLQQWQAEVTKLGGTAKIEEQEFEDGKGSKKPAVHFELPTLAEIGICATIGCQRVKQYPEGFDWDCCCKGCFATDGQHHDDHCDREALLAAQREGLHSIEQVAKQVAKQKLRNVKDKHNEREARRKARRAAAAPTSAPSGSAAQPGSSGKDMPPFRQWYPYAVGKS